jgi:hypothetical protein
MDSDDMNLGGNSTGSENNSIEGIQQIFFEHAGEQRLSILSKLKRGQSGDGRVYNLSTLATELDATMQEVLLTELPEPESLNSK